jgi:ribosome-binding factor A
VSGMSPRSQRVADQVRREIANLIQMEVSDPRVGMISVTSVEVSKDFAYAKVYVTVLNSMTGDAELNASTLTEPGKLDRLEIEENLKVLNKASGYLRSMLAKRLTLRTVPKLKFFYDGSVAKGHRLSNLIDDALAADKDQHT